MAPYERKKSEHLPSREVTPKLSLKAAGRARKNNTTYEDASIELNYICIGKVVMTETYLHFEDQQRIFDEL